MKIIITGASGFVGRLLVKDLIAKNIDCVLVGRSTDKLSAIFPDVTSCDYNQVKNIASDADVCVHLATANSDSVLPEDQVFAINVDFMLQVAKIMSDAGVKQFVNVSSVHALQLEAQTPYAQSKKVAAQRLEDTYPCYGKTVYLATVYGDQWAGKLSVLNRLPGWLARVCFGPVSALKPVVHISQLTAYILEIPFAGAPRSASILADDKAQNPFYTWSKRLIDLTFAIFILIFVGWAMVLVWGLVRLTSAGPGIFAQERVGKNGKVFTCYKFRTMQQNTEQVGTHEVSSASITRIGAFLRKTKLDELPQVANILLNQMSLIGPRPCLPHQTKLVRERQSQNVFDLKPGISGLAQINDIDMSTPTLLADWDAQYAKIRGILPDLLIIIATAIGRGQGDKVNHDSGQKLQE